MDCCLPDYCSPQKREWQSVVHAYLGGIVHSRVYTYPWWFMHEWSSPTI